MEKYLKALTVSDGESKSSKGGGAPPSSPSLQSTEIIVGIVKFMALKGLGTAAQVDKLWHNVMKERYVKRR